MLRPVINNNSIKETSPSNIVKSSPVLKPGTIIKGTVIQNLKGGDAIISSGGKSFKAYSSVPLKDGAKYDFMVMASKDKIELKVLGVQNKITGNISRVLSSANALGRKLTESLTEIINSRLINKLSTNGSELINNINKLVKSPIFQKDISEIILWVKKNIQGSGIFWENKVLKLLTGKKGPLTKEMANTDLKGILLGLMKSIENGKEDQEGLKALSMKIKEAISLIEQEQIMNISTMREGVGWFVHLPFPDDKDFLTSELFIKKDKQDGLYFSIFLDMSFTGKMEIDVSIVKDVTRIQISVENKQTKKFILENINQLEETFSKKAKTTCNISCEIKEHINFSDSVEKDIHSSVDLVI